MRLFFTILTLLLTVSFSPLTAFSQHQHGGMSGMPGMEGEKKAESMIGDEASPNRTFLLQGGIKAAFSIMAMTEHKKMLQAMKMKIEVEGTEYHMKEGDMVVVNPGALHEVKREGEFLCRVLTANCGGPQDKYEY